MEFINSDDFLEELMPILASCFGSDYAHYIARNNDFFLAVKQNVEETSAWRDEGFYADDDIRLAIGRYIMEMLGIEY